MLRRKRGELWSVWKLWNQLKNIEINRVFQQDITFYTERVPLRFTCISLAFELRSASSRFEESCRDFSQLNVQGPTYRFLAVSFARSLRCVYSLYRVYMSMKKKQARALLAPFLKANWTHKQYKKEKKNNTTSFGWTRAWSRSPTQSSQAVSVSWSIFDSAHVVACSNFNALKSLSCEWSTHSDPIHNWSIRFDVWLKISNLIFSWHDRILSMTQRAQKSPSNISKSERVMFT